MGVSVFYRQCPATSLYLASYPATPSGVEPTALVPVSGTCVPHSKTQGGTPPRMHCNAEGEWMVPVGGCVCDEGYEPNLNGSACLGKPDKKLIRLNSNLSIMSICISHEDTFNGISFVIRLDDFKRQFKTDAKEAESFVSRNSSPHAPRPPTCKGEIPLMTSLGLFSLHDLQKLFPTCYNASLTGCSVLFKHNMWPNPKLLCIIKMMFIIHSTAMA